MTERRDGGLSEGSRVEAGRGPEKDRRKNGEGTYVRSDQTYAASPMPHLRLLLLRVCKVHLGPGRRVASLNRAIYCRVQLPSITANRGKRRSRRCW